MQKFSFLIYIRARLILSRYNNSIYRKVKDETSYSSDFPSTRSYGPADIIPNLGF